MSSLTEQQVLEIVRTNYESLTLKLEDDLDQYERYAERPYETSFFTSMVWSFSANQFFFLLISILYTFIYFLRQKG